MYFRKVLIANRGEIANRIIRTLTKLHIASVAIYDDREKDFPYVKNAGEVHSIGTGSLADTFLNIRKIIQIAVTSGCDAVHPGYGFISENPEFALACTTANLTFIGPSADVISLMGNKIRANQAVKECGVPIIPNIKGDIEEICDRVPLDFFPCLIKASSGGGGKGMYIVTDPQSLKPLLIKASEEAGKYFNNKEVYIEKFIENPRHIEVQILADKWGNVVHLFERECTIQRRYQKIIEESPSSFMHEDLRKKLIDDSIKIARNSGYVGAGTMEFLVDPGGNYYFLEMNTRIQVEHTVTEMVTGIDIVEEQLAIAAGENINQRLSFVKISGHSIEARIYAEDPENNYQPSPGTVKLIVFPENMFLRVETDLKNDSIVFPDFDPMIAKLVVHGKDRTEAITRLNEVLQSTHIHGIRTNLKLLTGILNDEDFKNNNISTSYLNNKKFEDNHQSDSQSAEQILLLGTSLWLSIYRIPHSDGSYKNNAVASYIGRWRIHKSLRVFLDGKEYDIHLLRSEHDSISFAYDGVTVNLKITEKSGQLIHADFDSYNKEFNYSWNDKSYDLSISSNFIVHQFRRTDLIYPDSIIKNEFTEDINHPDLYAPLTGKISRIFFKEGEQVQKGEPIVLIESMKMENEIRMPHNGIINEILIKQGEIIEAGNILFRLDFSE